MRQDNAPTVLVVDHDGVASALLAQVLHMAGFRAEIARTGEAALALMIAQRDEIEWLVTKARLPGLVCGLILADEFSRWRTDRPVVFVGAAGAMAVNAIAVAEPLAPLQVVEVLKELRAAAQLRASEPVAPTAAAAA
jgi:DNA-binding NtrC family response regulator